VVSQIITTPQALSESYIPETILHREKELHQISSSLNTVNTFVYGSSGSGKTMLIKKAIDEFNASKKGVVIYIDCCLYQTTNAILNEILISLNTIVSTKSNYDLTKRLKARMRHLGYSIAVCLDHFERLKEIEAVNRLLSLGIKLVIVAESHEAHRRLNSMGKANITNIVEIASYSQEQSYGIVLNRAKEALEENTYSENALRKIVQLGSGNIALCLNLLKALALRAATENKASIDDVEYDYEADCENERLSSDERTLVKILEEQKSLPSNILYSSYSERARHPKSKRSFRNYMQNLCAIGLVRNIGEKRGRVYEIVDGILKHVQKSEDRGFEEQKGLADPNSDDS
jgi:Cdc6-like AAA superfamily ATPase